MKAIAGVLRARRKAEALMIDRCIVERPGAAITDPVTAKVIVPLTPVYPLAAEIGKCKLQQTLAQSSNEDSGGHQFTTQDALFDVPVGSGPFEVDDIVTIRLCVLDPHLVGRKLRIVERFNKTLATAQRLRVVEITG